MHRRRHAVKDISCPHCDFKANFPSALKKHIGLKHSPARFNKPWACPLCSFASNINWSLKAHLMNTHKLPKDEAYKHVNEVRQKYMEMNNGQQPHHTPLTAVSKAELEEALSQSQRTQPSDNVQVDNPQVDNSLVDNPLDNDSPVNNHAIANPPLSRPVFPSYNVDSLQ